MAYIKNNWVDREGTTRYFETVDTDGAKIFTPDYTQVTELGTPVNSDNMNHIEEGIAAGSFTKYDLGTTYSKDDLVTTIVDNELKVYKSLQDNNIGALDNSSFWEEVEFSGGSGAGLQMFDTILKDHVLTYEESKGLALQGTYVYKDAIAGSRYGYPDFYAKCLEEYNEATVTETVNGVTVKVHSNGHKFYDIANKSAIDGFFNTMGSAWFYGVDTAEERIFLPRNNFFEQMTGNVAEVGDSVQAGLPNITARAYWAGSYPTAMSGAFKPYTVTTNPEGAGNATSNGLELDASLSSPIYGRSSTVQPNAVKKLLYICVGNTVADTSWVDVVTQVEGGVKDLEDKTNEGLSALANASNALRQTQITNCLLEVPQRIKLKYNGNDTITVEKGNVFIVPYGNQTLPQIGTEIAPDIKVVDTSTSSNGQNFLYCEMQKEYTLTFGGGTGTLFNLSCGFNANGFYWTGTTGDTSGATDNTPANGTLWYDTTNNIIYRRAKDSVVGSYVAGGGINNAWISLPVSIHYGTPTKAEQIFNGFGYIGSTIWVDKGVKGLIPNGRNEDGTLNNIEFTVPKVYLRHSDQGSYSFHEFCIATTGIGISNHTLDEKENYLYRIGGTKLTDRFVAGNISFSQTAPYNITSFQPKQPFRAVDYSDKPQISGWGMPSSKYIDLTYGGHGANYTAPANGFFTIVGYGAESDIYLRNTTIGLMTAAEGNTSSGSSVGVFLPCKKGDVVQAGYYNGTVSLLRFIYAEGEV